MDTHKLLATLVLALGAPAFAATCWSPDDRLGVLPDADPVYFGSSCFGVGEQHGVGRHYDEYFSFTLDGEVSWLWGHAYMPKVRDGAEGSPTHGELLYGMTVDHITLEYDGTVLYLGTDSHLHEIANFNAADLAPGDYTLGFHGYTYGLGGAGSFNAVMGVAYVPAVPEPETAGLLLAGLVALVSAARRRAPGRCS